MARKNDLMRTLVAVLIAVGLAIGLTLVWPDDGNRVPKSTSQNVASDTAYWAQRAELEVQEDAAMRAGQARTPPPRTAPPTGMNGELDMLPARPVRFAGAAPSGRRMFRSCGAARAAGYVNIPRGHPAYHPDMDGDGDGYACEPYRGR